jgi:DHA2 family multidrug resistance protein
MITTHAKPPEDAAVLPATSDAEMTPELWDKRLANLELGLPEKSDTEWTPVRSSAGNNNPWLVAVIIALPVFLEVLDTTIANVSLRNIAGSLGAGQSDSNWVITSYLVANAVILPLSGWLGDVLGRKKFFTLCVLLFTVANLFCGMATSLPVLIFWRVVEGLGGGGMVPLSQTMLADSFPPNKRGTAFAIWGMAVICSPVIGPPLGGWITENYSWPWIFYMKVPLGLFSALLAWVFLTEPELLNFERKQRWAKGLHVDYIGFALAAVGLAFLEVVLAKGEELDWLASPFIRKAAVISAAALLIMAIWTWNRRDAIVEISLFRRLSFLSTFLVMFGGGMIIYSSNLVFPTLLQTLHGYTALTAGMALLPAGAAAAGGMILVGFLSQKVQARYLVAAGVLLQVVPYWVMSGFTPNLTFWHAALAMVPQMMGFGLIMIPATALSYDGLAPSQVHRATAIMNIARNIGGSAGISMVFTWISWRMQYHHSVLAEHINVFNPAVQDAMGGLQVVAGDGAASGEQVVKVADLMVNQQAAVMAFNDSFLMCLVLCAVLLAIVFLLPRNEVGKGHVAVH